MLKVEELKETNNLNEILPISLLTLQKIYLFYSSKEKVDYTIYTDGNIEHLDTWIDKRPSERDPFLEECGVVKRLELKVENANFLLLEKKYHEKMIRNLYINEHHLNKMMNYVFYQVSLNEKANLKIKRMEK